MKKVMSVTLLLAGAIMCNRANAQYTTMNPGSTGSQDTSVNRSRSNQDSSMNSNRDWDKTRQDTSANKNWNNNRQDSLNKNQGWNNKSQTMPGTQYDKMRPGEKMNKPGTSPDKNSINGMNGINGSNPADLSGWPQNSKKAAQAMIEKYGPPDAATADALFWKDKGQWKKIVVTKEETPHNFPMAHSDMLEQCISYKVPPAKYDELAKFDGSVNADRTRGTLSARCDKEENNILALNLAHDIITGKKTVEQARAALASNVKEKMNGGNPVVMQKLQFSPQANAGDDDNTAGIAKDGKKKIE